VALVWNEVAHEVEVPQLVRVARQQERWQVGGGLGVGSVRWTSSSAPGATAPHVRQRPGCSRVISVW
ncbi:MAG TPA: hypothetical protein VGM94_02690, partial [Galbitalea sp.]